MSILPQAIRAWASHQIQIHICTHTYRFICISYKHLCVRVCIYVYMFIHIQMTCISIYMYIYIYTNMIGYAYTRMYLSPQETQHSRLQAPRGPGRTPAASTERPACSTSGLDRHGRLKCVLGTLAYTYYNYTYMHIYI